MYTPSLFREPDAARARELMRRYPFALLVSNGPDGLSGSHLPMMVRDDGVIAGHMARANPQWRELEAAGEVMVVFSGPHAYVSPTWYALPERNVPTWSYVAVHAYGKARVVEDAERIRAMLAEQIAVFDDTGWSLASVPPEKIDGLIGAVVGFEIEVGRFDAKLKVGQNREPEDRAAAQAALAGRDDEGSKAIAEWMKVLGL